jgi:hypothetical protein
MIANHLKSLVSLHGKSPSEMGLSVIQGSIFNAILQKIGLDIKLLLLIALFL